MFSNPEKNLIQFGISTGMYVADFGVGAGYYALSIARKVGEDGRVYCIDVENDMLTRLSMQAEEESLHNMEFILSDLENHKGSTIKKDHVDVVVIANTFFTLENKLDVLAEAYRILKNKGRLLFIDWADSFAGMGPHKDHVIKKDDAQKMLTESGFEFEREIDAGDHHYGLVLRKNEKE